ncbi:MAG: transcription elongation factor Spt5 [Candidatus Aenigmarchaeota archaeon]|nr:transcription elongation factor Spt5 [Candidatus Aenigmarchaeota archaeon]
MIFTVRTTTGRENIVIESIISRVRKAGVPIKSVFHPEELRGYIFIEGESNEIDEAVRGIPHIRGVIGKDVSIPSIEKFLVPEKSEIKFEIGDVVEIIGGPFKGEKAKITRTDEAKAGITVELLEAAIPIPVTISVNSVRMYGKAKSG